MHIMCEPERVVARSSCYTLRGSFSVCILCVSLGELLLGVVASHLVMYAMYLLWYMYSTIQCRTINTV